MQTQTIHLAKDGFQEIQVDCDKQRSLLIHVDKRRHVQLYVTYLGRSATLDITIQMDQGTNGEIVFWNETREAFQANIQLKGEKDAALKLGVADLSTSKSDVKINGVLNHSGMQFHVTTAMLALYKHVQMEMHHTAPNSEAVMENFAVVIDAGSYQMHASGRIDKGAKQSISHQATRVLTLSQNQTSEVLPILYIDENDVKASHATTLGQPDDLQLYYLCSRGLTRTQAIALMTHGYLMPITNVIKQKALSMRLVELIEEKVMVHAQYL